MSLFVGHNTFRSKGCETAVIGTIEKETTDGTIRSVIDLFTDTEHLYKSMEIKAGASVEYGAYSASARMSFFESMKLDTNSIVLVINVATGKKTTASDWKIKKSVESEAERPNGVKTFIKKYGDCFATQITTGAEYIAAFVFYCESVEHKMNVAAEVKAAGNFWGAQVSVDFSTKLESAMKSVKVQSHFSQSLKGFSQLDEPLATGGVPEIIEFASKIPTLTPTDPAVIEVTYTGYEEVLTKLDFDAVRDNRRSFLGTEHTSGWAGQKLLLQDLKNGAANIKRIHDFYGQYEDPGLDSKRGQIKQDILNLDNFLNGVGDDPTVRHTFRPESLDFGSPHSNYHLDIHPGFNPATGNGGFFQDIERSDVAALTRISSFVVSWGNWINYIIVTYETADGKRNAVMHGTAGGHTSEVHLENIEDSPEYVTKIDSCWGDYVDRVNITTSEGKTMKTYEPATAPNSNNGSWSAASDGGYLIGFAGRAGVYVDQLRPIILRLQPTTWIVSFDKKPTASIGVGGQL